MKKFLIVFVTIFLIGGLIYFSQNNNLKENSTSSRKLSADTKIYKSDDKGDFKIYKKKITKMVTTYWKKNEF